MSQQGIASRSGMNEFRIILNSFLFYCFIAQWWTLAVNKYLNKITKTQETSDRAHWLFLSSLQNEMFDLHLFYTTILCILKFTSYCSWLYHPYISLIIAHNHPLKCSSLVCAISLCAKYISGKYNKAVACCLNRSNVIHKYWFTSQDHYSIMSLNMTIYNSKHNK